MFRPCVACLTVRLRWTDLDVGQCGSLHRPYARSYDLETAMPSTRQSTMPADVPSEADGFDVLDVCHRHTLFTLGKLAALVARLKGRGPDPEARAIASSCGESSIQSMCSQW